MTTLEKVNSLPNLIKNQIITEKQGVEILCTEFLKNPIFFTGRFINEEAISDLIFYMLSAKKNIFKSFKKDNSSFFEYFKSFLIFKLKTLKKIYINKMIEDSTFFCDSEIFNEENQSKYTEYCLKTASFEPYTLTEKDKIPYSQTFHSKTSGFNFKEHIQNLNSSKKTALICALKYCYYIEDENLKVISEYCKIPESIFIKIKEKFACQLTKKSKKITELKEKRNKAYFLRRKYSIQLQELKLSDSEYSKKEKLFNNQNKYWQNKIKEIKSKRNLLLPSNKDLSEVLGINERTISFHLNKAKKIGNENDET